MGFAEYADYDGLGLAELVTKGKVTPLELIDAAIERAERHNPTLNAIVFEAYDEARDVAKGKLPDGPFKGVPFLIKDLGSPVKGWRRSSGSRFVADVVDDHDSTLVTRFRAAGTVLFGKTNTPEYGITGTTGSRLLGPCRNPGTRTAFRAARRAARRRPSAPAFCRWRMPRTGSARSAFRPPVAALSA